MQTVTFKRVHSATRGSSSYRADGFPGVVQLARAAWNGQHPESLVIQDVPDAQPRAVKSSTDKIEKQLLKAQAKVEALLKAKEAAAVAVFDALTAGLTAEPVAASTVEPTTAVAKPKAVKK